MKRIISLLLLAVLLTIGVLAGCSGKSTSDQGNGEQLQERGNISYYN